jgi:hypothetical protein
VPAVERYVTLDARPGPGETLATLLLAVAQGLGTHHAGDAQMAPGY